MTPEKNRNQYSEAQFELAWLDRNTSLFSAKASGYFDLVGRGAIIVDAAAKYIGEGALFTYFSKGQMEHIADEEVCLMVDTYDPANEFVVLLLLPDDKKRAYRVHPSEDNIFGAKSSSGLSYAGT